MTFVQWLADLLQRVKLWAVVQPWEIGVRVRVGRFVTKLNPGFHWRLPFLDTVTIVNTRLRVVAFPALTVTTMCGKTMTVAGSVGLRIHDPFAAMMAVSHPEDTYSALVQGVAARYIATHRADEVSVAKFEHEVIEKLHASEIPGVTCEFVNVVDFAAVRTIRLLQEQWRPGTGYSSFDACTK